MYNIHNMIHSFGVQFQHKKLQKIIDEREERYIFSKEKVKYKK